MGTVSTVKTQRLLDPANSTLEGQARVNAEIFTAVEILGRKLERVAAERDRLAERLALIESQAAVDEKTGRLYLPVVVTPETQMPPAAALPRWVVSASLASAALALFAVGLALFRPVAPPLTKSQIAVLNALSASQFTQLDPDSEKWKKLAGAQPPAPPQSAQPALAETTATPVPPQSAATQNAAAAMPFAPAQQAAQPAAAPALTQAEETVQAPAPETEAAATAPTPATAQPA
ncbi:MAG: hypothetical protein KGQ70_09440, partial [Alphaproteobacteria bacterium]|nr:hypothetical protein [Alphaproteobacteria bacterium]